MLPGEPRILTINAGSSSIKFALFEVGDSLRRILEGGIYRIGLPESTWRVKGLNPADNFSRMVTAPDYTAAVGALMDWIEGRCGQDALTAVGHRVVHGGPKYSKPQQINAEMVEELRRLSPFDPEHLPEEILLTEAFHRRFPDLPQVACFDTAFHHDLARVAQLLPIPRRYEAQGVRRYGFHGLSYAFLMQELSRLAGAEAAQGRIILAHLGNGASLAAVRDGKPVDTSMCFTPTAGVPMSTRSGDLDPGLLWYLARTEGLDAKRFNEMVNFQSGLLGVSETSSDMRDLLAHETQDVRAAEAVALFCYQVKKWIGAFAAALGGLDTLVFAGGIGENAPTVRARICDGMGFLGIELEEKRNAANEGVISAAASRVAARVIRTDEEQMIARSVCRTLGLEMAIEKMNSDHATKYISRVDPYSADGTLTGSDGTEMTAERHAAPQHNPYANQAEKIGDCPSSAHSSLPWRRLGRFFATTVLASFVLNEIWEMAQMSAYVETARHSWVSTLGLCTRAAVGDVGIILGIYAAGALAAGDPGWGLRGSLNNYATAAVLGLAYAALVEHVALAAGRWSYTERMPVVPVIEAGLWPLLQMALLPPLIFLFARRWAGRSATKWALC
jgi:acetate kinase